MRTFFRQPHPRLSIDTQLILLYSTCNSFNSKKARQRLADMLLFYLITFPVSLTLWFCFASTYATVHFLLHKFFPLHRVGAKWVHFLTLTSCALNPRASTSSLKQPNCTQKPREPSLKPPLTKPFNDSPRKPLLHKGKFAPT